MFRTTTGWKKLYEEKGALWIHDGNLKRPHALLTSGRHSSGFFNSELVMEDPFILDKGCSDLVQLLHNQGLEVKEVNRVIGPAMGAITLAHDMARKIGQFRGVDEYKEKERCFRSYTEKGEKDGKKIMIFERTRIIRGERVLSVEDVLTTGESTNLTSDAVEIAGGIVLPFVGVIVNRSGLERVNGKKIVALINHPMPTWRSNKCPLCPKGSKALRPKEAENWELLNSEYN